MYIPNIAKGSKYKNSKLSPSRFISPTVKNTIAALQQSMNGTTQKSNALTANPCFGRPAQSSRSLGGKWVAMMAEASSGTITLLSHQDSITSDQNLKAVTCADL
jgi:hypothetical protein